MDNAVIVEKVERIEKDVDSLKKWREETNVLTVETNYELKELIVQAVAEGQKATLQEIDKVKKKVEILENESGEKAKEELKNQRNIKSQFLISITLIILTALISFFSGIILNSMSDTKTVEQKVQEQIQYKNSIQEVVL